MDWISFASPAAVALVTGATSVLTLALANRHARGIDAMHLREGRQRLRFEAQERRYDDRRDAVIAMDQAAEKETDKVEDFERDPSGPFDAPGDAYDDYRFPELLAAHARVVMLATPEVIEAADELRAAVEAAFHGEKGHWERYRAAVASYRTRSRAMLASDTHVGGASRPS